MTLMACKDKPSNMNDTESSAPCIVTSLYGNNVISEKNMCNSRNVEVSKYQQLTIEK